MPLPIDRELCDIEQALSNIELNYPQIARDAAQKRFDLEIARAEAFDEIEHRVLPDGAKKPTVAAIEAQVDLMTKEKLEASRTATAELDIAKVALDSLQSRLSSIQTRSKMLSMEMSLAR
jgi:hypothetical protein